MFGFRKARGSQSVSAESCFARTSSSEFVQRRTADPQIADPQNNLRTA